MVDLVALVEIGGQDLIEALRDLIPYIEDYLEATKAEYYERPKPPYVASIKNDRRALRRALARAKRSLEEIEGPRVEPDERVKG